MRPGQLVVGGQMDEETIMGAVHAIQRADLLIVGGTSLAVYPAAGLLQYYRGRELVLLNKTPTPADSRATLIIREPIGQVLEDRV